MEEAGEFTTVLAVVLPSSTSSEAEETVRERFFWKSLKGMRGTGLLRPEFGIATGAEEANWPPIEGKANPVDGRDVAMSTGSRACSLRIEEDDSCRLWDDEVEFIVRWEEFDPASLCDALSFCCAADASRADSLAAFVNFACSFADSFSARCRCSASFFRDAWSSVDGIQNSYLRGRKMLNIPPPDERFFASGGGGGGGPCARDCERDAVGVAASDAGVDSASSD